MADSKGEAAMNGEHYRDAIFQACMHPYEISFPCTLHVVSLASPSSHRCAFLAPISCDLWTDTLDPHEYVAFLTDLLAKMKAAGLGQQE